MIKNKAQAIAIVATSAAAFSGSASAAIDTAPLLSSITEAGTAAGVIGVAVLVVVVSIRALKYIKQAL